jgi:uncharacterized membrane protein YiaA
MPPRPVPPAYDDNIADGGAEGEQQRRREALFNLCNRSLYGTSEWRLQTRVTLLFAISFVCYNLYWMESTKELKMLAFAVFAWTCYSAINLASQVRNRVEAARLDLYARDTSMYSVSIVSTLRGADFRYYFHWVVFAVAMACAVYVIGWLDMPTAQRGYFASAEVMLLIACNTTVKDVRDREDASKWWSEYHGQDFKEE